MARTELSTDYAPRLWKTVVNKVVWAGRRRGSVWRNRRQTMNSVLRSFFIAVVILFILLGLGYTAVATAGQIADWIPITALIIIGLVVAFAMWYKLVERT